MMRAPISCLHGLIIASFFLAVPAASQTGNRESDHGDFMAQRDALKERVELDLEGDVTLSFIHNGVLPDPVIAPAFWEFQAVLGQEVILPEELRSAAPSFVVAQAAGHLMPSCRVPYEKLAGEIGGRAGSRIEVMDRVDDAVRDLIGSPDFLFEHAALLEAARTELIVATDLTCKVLAPRNGHAMTAVAAMRMAGGQTPARAMPVPNPSPEGSCRTNFDGGFR